MKIKKSSGDLINKNQTTNDEIKEKNSVKAIDSIIFDSFKKLTSETEKDRVLAGLQLLQHLSKNKSNEKHEKEIEYALKRLIRGIGASTTQSRAGFFTTLVGFLESDNSDVSVEKILQVASKQLKVSAVITNKEDADAIVGKILTCGALLRSHKILQASTKDISNIIEILIESSKHKTYHNALAFSFIGELLNKITEKQFTTSVWPKLEPELYKPWPKQNINTINCLIIALRKFPNILTAKYLKTHFGGSELLNSQSYSHLLKLYWENTNVDIVAQPAFESFGIYIGNCKHLIEFWTNNVNEFLSKHITKLVEIQTLKIFTDILLNSNKTTLSLMFTENFMIMLTTSLKKIKTTKKDETLKAFYDDFFDALQIYCNKLNSTSTDSSAVADNEKIEIIRKLILYPGILNIEKYTKNRIIHQIIANLKENGIKELFQIYKEIFLNKIVKNSNDDQWLNVERQNAGYMLQTLISHKSVQTEIQWRLEQLKFFMILSLFNTNSNLEIISKKYEDTSSSTTTTTNDDDECRSSSLWLSNDFTEQMKNIFYTSLQSKMTNLNDEKILLHELIEFCNEILNRKHFNKYLKNKIDEKIIKIWHDMYNKCFSSNKKKTGKKDNDKLQLVFHILLLHMGLQLFREPEMAEAAILDLETCMENIKIKKSNNIQNDDEPEWIEVVVDLFLHLLSQNTSALRNIVNLVFPHLCSSLSLTAVNQILSVLEMKDGYNPLCENNEETNDNISDSESESEKSSEDDDDEEEDNSSENENDDSTDDDEIMDEEEEEEPATETDKLRNAISIALGTIGKDADQESVDLDDMNEEDGRKLDEALAEAFKAMRKTSDSNKRSKNYRIKTTTVMHFRIRVLDLIEIYIQHNPSLLIILEILINLFNMIEYCCTEKDLLPLSTKLDKVLNKLTSLRQFSNTDDVSVKNISDYLRLIIEKKIRSTSFDAHNKIRSKCCHFLILSSKQLTSTVDNDDKHADVNNEISEILNEYIKDFIKSRNPIVNITLLGDIFKMRWHGVWNLATTLIQNGLIETTRTYRRIQIIELLENLYKNHELIRQNMKLSRKSFKIIEEMIEKHLKMLSSNLEKISVREFTTILDLLVTINRCHNKIQLDTDFNRTLVCERVQEIRKKIKLDQTQSYSRFCNIFAIKIIKNSDVIVPNVTMLENGTCQIVISEGDDDDDNEEEKSTEINKKIMKKQNRKDKVKKEKLNCDSADAIDGAIKRKKSSVENNDFRKEKKLKKENRMKFASKGLNGGFTFDDAPVDITISDGSVNGDSGAEEEGSTTDSD